MKGTDAVAAPAREDAGAAGQIDRTIVQVATAAAMVFLVAIVVSSMASGRSGDLVRAVPPLVVAASGMIMLIMGRPHALAHLIAGMAGLVFIVSVDGGAVRSQPQLGLLSMAVVGTLLVHKRLWLYIVALVPVMAYAGYAWHPEGFAATDRFQNATSTLLLFAITGSLLGWSQTVSNKRRLRLEQLARAKDEFVAVVSHELRTPMTAILGVSSELVDRFDEFGSAEIKDLLGLMQRESQDVVDIVEDLLVLGQDGVGNLRLNRQATRLADEVRHAVASDPLVRLELDPHSDLSVYVDSGRTRQVLRNLLANARRYGGPDIRIVLRKTQDRALIEVRDTGNAISNEDRELMFMPYHRTRASLGAPGSVGLGLTVSRRLARLMDGELDYHHDGFESVFTLSLPLFRPAPGQGLTAVA